MTCVRITNGIVCFADEVETTSLDLRTRDGRESEVLAQIRQFGGFSGFWATENLKRAYAIGRLTKAGKIQMVESDRPFPWCVYREIG